MLNAPNSEGGLGQKQEQGWTRQFSLIYLIPLGLSSICRTSPYRSRKIGEDESDPPLKTGGHVAPIAALVGQASIRPHGGRSRPYFSLREGSKKAHSGERADAMNEGLPKGASPV